MSAVVGWEGGVGGLLRGLSHLVASFENLRVARRRPRRQRARAWRGGGRSASSASSSASSFSSEGRAGGGWRHELGAREIYERED